VRAGVSIGSLYQYFPDKEAILVNLLLRHQDAVHEVASEFQSRLSDVTVPLAQSLTNLIHRLVELHEKEPQLNRILSEHVPRPPEMEERERTEVHAYIEQLEQALRQRKDVSVRNPHAAAHLLVQTVGALTRWLGHEAPPNLDRRTVISEAITMLTGYIHGGSKT